MGNFVDFKSQNQGLSISDDKMGKLPWILN